jgi:NADH-quinone oxidoreductase subunit M
MSDTMPLLLNLVLFLPLIGIALVTLLPARAPGATRQLTFAVMVLQLLLTGVLYANYASDATGLQFATQVPWIGAWGVSYSIGLDGYNVLLVLLTALLGPLVVASAFRTIEKDVKLFYAMVLLVQFAMMGTLLAQDLFLFYLFWEAMLIPMFLLIGIWGGERRIYATVKFVLYTAFGSILMLAAMIYLVYALQQTKGVTSFAFTDLYTTHLPLNTQLLLLGAFALSFAIKVPMVPFHTWLPDAHVEAPTAGSVILAGVMLKMGTYGFMKLGFPLFPDATAAFTPLLMTLSVIGIVYGACLALVQNDIKKIIAYSSISHLGYVMLGLLSLDLIGIQGAMVQMVSHGLVAGGLFLLVGMIYDRCHTRDLGAYGGMAKLMPVFAVFFLIFTLASVGLPTTSGFTGEFMVLLGAFRAGWSQHTSGSSYALVLAAISVTGVVLGALYMLRLALHFLFGAAKAPGVVVAPEADHGHGHGHGDDAAISHAPHADASHGHASDAHASDAHASEGHALHDLDWRERGILAVLTVAVFALGLFPEQALKNTEPAAKAFRQLITTSRLPMDAPKLAEPAAVPPSADGVSR